MKLAQTQAAFQTNLLNNDESILSQIHSTSSLDNQSRMAIYAHAYRARLKEVLRTDFPAVTRCLQDQADATFDHYITAYPSQHFSLRYFGQHFAHFLSQTPLHSTTPWLSDLARFEWAFCDAFDAANTTVVQVSDLANIAPHHWPYLRFILHPSTQFLSSHYPLPLLWRAKDHDDELPSVERLTEPLHFIFWRQPDLASHFRHLAPDEVAAFQAVRNGNTFAELCEQLLPWHEPDNVAMRAASLLKTWVEEGLVAGTQIAEN